MSVTANLQLVLLDEFAWDWNYIYNMPRNHYNIKGNIKLNLNENQKPLNKSLV